MLIALLVRLAAFIRTVRFESWRRPNYIHPSNTIEPNMNSHSNSTVQEVVNEEDHVRPRIDRLQKLEKAFEELNNKPAVIPIEKEKMLMESLDRIKSVKWLQGDEEESKREKSIPYASSSTLQCRQQSWPLMMNFVSINLLLLEPP
ncbi:hypothetical protein V6N13_136855 [Hibiscus sabdariffa]